MFLMYFLGFVCMLQGIVIDVAAVAGLAYGLLKRKCPRFAVWDAKRKEARREKQEAKKLR